MIKEKIVLLGAGNLAVHLGKALYKGGFEILQVYSRTIESANILAQDIKASSITDINAIKNEATCIIFALNDSVLGEILARHDWGKDKLLLHTSGSISIDIFKNFSKNYGVFYPLQTFSKFRPVNFTEIPVFLEANTKDNLARIMNIAKKISLNIHLADSSQRQTLHLAGIFMNNFVNYFYTKALQLTREFGCRFDFDIFKPIIIETALKAIETGNPEQCQTGPAFRLNKEIVAKHSELLHHDPEIQNLYTFVSNSIAKFYHNETLI